MRAKFGDTAGTARGYFTVWNQSLRGMGARWFGFLMLLHSGHLHKTHLSQLSCNLMCCVSVACWVSLRLIKLCEPRERCTPFCKSVLSLQKPEKRSPAQILKCCPCLANLQHFGLRLCRESAPPTSKPQTMAQMLVPHTPPSPKWMG